MTGNLGPLPTIFNWKYLRFGFIELILNQFDKIFVSCCKSSKIISKSLSHLYIELSSAKLHMFALWTKRKRLLINALNNTGTKVDPCGIYEEFTFNLDLLIPWVSSFAVRRSCSKQSKASGKSIFIVPTIPDLSISFCHSCKVEIEHIEGNELS